MNGFFGKVNDIVLKAIEDCGEDAEAIREEARGLVKLGLVARFGNPTQSLATNFTKDANAWNTFFSQRAKTRLDIAGTPSLIPHSNLDVHGSFGTASTDASEEWRAMGQEQKAKYGEKSLQDKQRLLLDPDRGFDKRRKRAWKLDETHGIISPYQPANVKV